MPQHFACIRRELGASDSDIQDHSPWIRARDMVMRTSMFPMIVETVFTAFWACQFVAIYRFKKDFTISDLLKATGIIVGLFFVMFCMFYVASSMCDSSRLWDFGSALYGSDVESCFTERSRAALSIPIGTMYGTPLGFVATVLLRLSKQLWRRPR